MDITKMNHIHLLEIDGLTALAIHGNLCLALRHPENNGASRYLIEKTIKEIEVLLIEDGLINKDDLREIHRVEKEEGGLDWQIDD